MSTEARAPTSSDAPPILAESRRAWIGIVVLLIATAAGVLSAIPAAVAGLNAVAFLVTLYYPPLGVAAWFAVLPFTFYWPEDVGQFLAFRQSVAVLAGSSLVVIARRAWSDTPGEGLPRLHKSGFAFLVGFCFFTGVAAVASSVPSEIHIGLIATLGALMCLATGWAIRAHPAGFRVLSAAVAVVALLAVGVALLEYGGGQARLRVGDNVRKVATPIGLALTVLLCGLLSRRDSPDIPLREKPIAQLALTAALVATLAITMSRGTAVAVLAAVFAFGSARVLMGGRTDLTLSFGKLTAALTVVAAAGLYAWNRLAGSAFGLRFFGRWREVLAAPGEAIRIRIWRTALGEMSGWEWMVGAGPGTFRRLARQGGLDYYAHSVFVDLLVTTGLAGLLALFGFLVWIAVQLWRSGSALGLAVLAYTVVSFSTFGATAQSFFWASLGLAYGLAWRDRSPLPVSGSAERVQSS